jgi:putative ABC transport system permease protein
MLLATDAVTSNDVVKRIINARLVERHHGLDDFSLIDFASVLRKFYAAFVIMEVVASCLAGVALVIGGIGIMNMMLVSVSERTREIGIQKAVGAQPAHLRAQFLSEAALLSLAGGVAGTALGLGVASLASLGVQRLVSSWVGATSWTAVGAALLSALSVGIAFGWLPARRAAHLDPVEAMRR